MPREQRGDDDNDNDKNDDDDDDQAMMAVMKGERTLEFDNGEDAMNMKKYLRLLCDDISRERHR